MKNISRDDLQERVGKWYLVIALFLLFIGCSYLFLGELDEEGGSIILVLAAITLIATVVLAIRCWRAKRALKRIPHEI